MPVPALLHSAFEEGPFQACVACGKDLTAPAATYQVLVQDYIYWGGSGYLFYTQDPSPVDLGVNYRQPVIDWTAAQSTSAASPLEDLVDPDPRVL